MINRPEEWRDRAARLHRRAGICRGVAITSSLAFYPLYFYAGHAAALVSLLVDVAGATLWASVETAAIAMEMWSDYLERM